jgi:hypothetical protein
LTRPRDVGIGSSREEVKVGTVIAIKAEDFKKAVKALAPDKNISEDQSVKIIEPFSANAIDRSSELYVAMPAPASGPLAVTTGSYGLRNTLDSVHDSIIALTLFEGQNQTLNARSMMITLR